MFTRRLIDPVLTALKADPLFEHHLREDCLKGKVFPAIRQDKVEFYYRGNRLFEYGAGLELRTYSKFALVAEKDQLVSQRDLKRRNVPLITSFEAHYEDIKALCAVYGMPESTQVAILCERFSFAKRGKPHRIVVLDTEAGFGGESYVDLVFYDKESGRLRFCEVKRRGDKRNWQPATSAVGKPEVVEQVHRYRSEIQRNHDAIAGAYESYIRSMRSLLGLSESELPLPGAGQRLAVEDDVPLLLVGYDSRQLSVAKRLKADLEAHGLTVHAIGSTGSVSAETLERKWFR